MTILLLKKKLEASGLTGGVPGATSWGMIGGTLSFQTDLQGALNGKVSDNDSRLSDARTPTTHSHEGYEPANANIQSHVASTHAPSNAQKNSDILKTEIESVLTGELTSHTHAGGAGGLTQPQILARGLGA